LVMFLFEAIIMNCCSLPLSNISKTTVKVILKIVVITKIINNTYTVHNKKLSDKL